MKSFITKTGKKLILLASAGVFALGILFGGANVGTSNSQPNATTIVADGGTGGQPPGSG